MDKTPYAGLDSLSQTIAVSLTVLDRARAGAAELPESVRQSLDTAVHALKDVAKTAWEARNAEVLDAFVDLRRAVIAKSSPAAVIARDRLVSVLDASPSSDNRVRARNRLIGLAVNDYSEPFLIDLEFLIFGGRIANAVTESDTGLSGCGSEIHIYTSGGDAPLVLPCQGGLHVGDEHRYRFPPVAEGAHDAVIQWKGDDREKRK